MQEKLKIAQVRVSEILNDLEMISQSLNEVRLSAENTSRKINNELKYIEKIVESLNDEYKQ